MKRLLSQEQTAFFLPLFSIAAWKQTNEEEEAEADEEEEI